MSTAYDPLNNVKYKKQHQMMSPDMTVAGRRQMGKEIAKGNS